MDAAGGADPHRDWGVPADLLENEIGKQQLALAKHQGTEHDRLGLRATSSTIAWRCQPVVPLTARSSMLSNASVVPR